MTESLERHVEWFMNESETDAIGLWEIVRAAQDAGQPAGRTAVADLTLDIVDQLLGRGLVAADLTATGHWAPWTTQDRAAVLMRIRNAWAKLGRDPNVGEIVWLVRPENDR